MNWYKTAQNIIILWHATVPRLADVILEQGIIKPGMIIEEETGQSQSGWNFQLPGSTQYGEGVYLATTKSSAEYYAFLRLKREWEQEDRSNLYDEEQYGHIGVFKINISNKTLLKDIDSAEEYIYLGAIPSQPNKDAWFEGPEWIDKTKELEEYINKLENIYNELV